jgi:L-methionine (R)-S-oxide reductase
LTRPEKTEKYIAAQQRITSVLQHETNPITVMAFTAAILKESFPQFYWVGFLLTETNQLTVGPFQGPPSCIRLPLDSPGVCGTCYRTARPVLVPDVAAFHGRVSCDVVPKSEIAMPLLSGNRVVAVLDIDCTEVSGLDDVDQQELDHIVRFVASRFQESDRTNT